MNHYQFILLDADNTIMDFDKAQDYALEYMLKKYRFEWNQQIKSCYEQINHKLWESFNRGQIKKEQLLQERFIQFFERMGWAREFEKSHSYHQFNQEYVYHLGDCPDLIEGAFEFLQEMNQECELYIVTNGVTITQTRRLKASGIGPFIKESFISEQIGFQKPQREYFDYVFSHINGFEKEKALIVGDSLSSDIQGGNNADIAACWYNPNRLKNDEKVICNYVVYNYEELRQVIREGKI